MWFRVDDQLHSHPKAVEAGNAAMGLWVRVGSWCANHLTDGHFSRATAVLFDPELASLQRLVATGWVEALEAERYLLHDYLDYNYSRKQAKQLKKTRAKAGKHGGSKPKAKPKQNPSKRRSRCAAKGTGTGTGSGSGSKKKRKAPIPADWQPNDTDRRRASELGLGVVSEERKFREWTTAKGFEYVDWHAAFRSHLEKAAERVPPGRRGHDDCNADEQAALERRADERRAREFARDDD